MLSSNMTIVSKTLFSKFTNGYSNNVDHLYNPLGHITPSGLSQRRSECESPQILLGSGFIYEVDCTIVASSVSMQPHCLAVYGEESHLQCIWKKTLLVFKVIVGHIATSNGNQLYLDIAGYRILVCIHLTMHGTKQLKPWRIWDNVRLPQNLQHTPTTS